MLSLIIVLPLLAAVALVAVPRLGDGAARWVWVVVAAVGDRSRDQLASAVLLLQTLFRKGGAPGYGIQQNPAGDWSAAAQIRSPTLWKLNIES